MNFQTLKAFQDNLMNLGIGGNDMAIYVDGKMVYRHFSGFQNIEKNIPIHENTLYRMFSMTKPIVCAAAMQLFEQGKFLLNDPVADYLPEFAHMQVIHHQPDGNNVLKPAQNVMRVQHLFEMTSGLDYELQSPALVKLWEDTQGHYTTRQYAQAIAQSPLGFEPGTHWRYSLSHDVLGALVEVISGQTLSDYCRDHIFTPLGMESACFRDSEIDPERLCVRYGFDGQKRTLIPGDQTNCYQISDQCFSGGAGSTMTVDDYAKFACAMTNRGMGLNGHRLLAGRTVDLMRTNRLHDVALKDMWNSSLGRWGYGYGLGVRTMHIPAASGSVTPVGEFGWGGAWGTYVIMDPENKVTLVFAEQGVEPLALYIQRRLRNMAYAALEWEGLI